MTGAILTLNAGSSSLKFALFETDGEALIPTARGQIEGIGVAPHLTAKGMGGEVLEERRWPRGEGLDHESFLGPLLGWVEAQLGGDDLVAVGHRVVHGGATFSAPVAIDDAVLAKLEALCPLAPLHQPHNLAGVRAARAARSDLPQVACFDTTFHHGHAEVVAGYALPRAWRDLGVRRYGFHGLSYEYVMSQLRTLDPALAAGRVIVAHLGAGASLCAIAAGRSVDTTMGFTALDGLMMATRCGTLDPGVVLYLQQQEGLTADQVATLLYEQSGLLGVSGVSGDMRTLLASSDIRAKQAIELYIFRIAREAGALMSSLGGLDGIVFTAGVGENAPEIRWAIAERLAWTGLVLDPAANAVGRGCIHDRSSRLEAWVVPTDEETTIARHAKSLVRQTQS